MLKSNDLGGVFWRAVIAAPVTLVVLLGDVAFAERRVPIAGSKAPEGMCSTCEDSDRGTVKSCRPKTDANYCPCLPKGSDPLRVFVRANSMSSWISFGTYQTQQLKRLEQSLKKKKKSPKFIKKELSALRKKLDALYLEYKTKCGGSGGGATPPPVINDNGAFSVQLLSYKDVKHTYAMAISEKGRILGGAFEQEGAPRAAPVPHTFSATELISRIITPLVWSGSGVKRGCDNCQPGIVMSRLNDQGQAVGTRYLSTAGQTNGILFDYNNENVTPVTVGGSKSVMLPGINSAGMMVGSIEREMSTGVDRLPLFEPAVWVNGNPNIISRETIMAAHEIALRPLMLEQIKARLKEAQDMNECGDGEIAQTVLVGKPTYKDWVTISGLDISEQGDILGMIVSKAVSWSYTNPCTSGAELLGQVMSSFVRKVDGTLAVTPSAFLIPETRTMGMPAGLFSNLSVFGASPSLSQAAGNITMPGFLDILVPNARWRRATYPGTESFVAVTPTGVNDRGDIVGVYITASPNNSARAFAVLNGAFTDLTSLLGAQSEWIFEAATDINSCGQIVGRAYNQRIGVNRAILISPKGCPVG